MCDIKRQRNESPWTSNCQVQVVVDATAVYAKEQAAVDECRARLKEALSVTKDNNQADEEEDML